MGSCIVWGRQWPRWLWIGCLLSVAACPLSATPITGGDVPVHARSDMPRPGRVDPLGLPVADDADYWTILLLDSIDDEPGDPLGAVNRFLQAFHARVSRLLHGLRGEGTMEGDVTGEALADPTDMERTRALLGFFRLDDDPADDDGSIPDETPALFPDEWVGKDNVPVPGTQRGDVIPLSRLFLSESRSQVNWLGGGNRFLSGPIERSHLSSMRITSLRQGQDVEAPLLNVAEWIDAIVHYRPGPRAWITLLLVGVLLVLLRIRHLRMR